MPTSQSFSQPSNLLPCFHILRSLCTLLPKFHNFPNSSFQPPNLPPNPYLQSQTSTYPFNTLTSQPVPPGFQMTPSASFAALSDPITLFDGLDHTYPPETFLAHLSALVKFELGPQPLAINPI